MTKTVLGIFSDRDDAEDAVVHLEEVGFSPKDISIVMKDHTAAQDFADDSGTSVASGAVTGATTGAALGGLAGLLLGLGSIAIPGVGAFLIGGPIATALGLTGAAATTITGATTGAVAGGLLGALMGLGLSEDEARVYEEGIQEGGILVAVPANSDIYEDVKDILQQHGADQIRTISQKTDDIPDYSSYDNPHSYMHMGAKGGKTRRLRKARN